MAARTATTPPSTVQRPMKGFIAHFDRFQHMESPIRCDAGSRTAPAVRHTLLQSLRPTPRRCHRPPLVMTPKSTTVPSGW